eukprot:scaffold474_cov365-Prasinococcus_capsulatus_cf.AAC.10
MVGESQAGIPGNKLTRGHTDLSWCRSREKGLTAQRADVPRWALRAASPRPPPAGTPSRTRQARLLYRWRGIHARPVLEAAGREQMRRSCRLARGSAPPSSR